MKDGESDVTIDVPAEFSGQKLADLLKAQPKKKKPKTVKATQFEVPIGSGWRVTRKDSGAVQNGTRDMVDIATTGWKPRNPKSIENQE